MDSSLRPNILFIFTDQQSFNMLSCAGNSELDTPHLDALAARGTRFTRAYCCQPLCVPSRGAMSTGLTSREIGILGNDEPDVNPAQAPAWVAKTLAEAGYRTHYVGKWHQPIDEFAPEIHGWQEVIQRLDPHIPAAFASTLPGDAPFFTTISLTNPHDICKIPFKLDKRLACGPLPPPPPVDELPPLPDNCAITPDEPSLLRQRRETTPPEEPSSTWTDDYWRIYRWAYARLTERVDAVIGDVLAALEASGKADNTVIVFTSDHGEGNGAHGWTKKDGCQEEVIHVPLIIMDPRQPQAFTSPHLVSTGLDLFPTFCDYAGVPAPDHLQGRSLRPLCEAEPAVWRDHLVVEAVFGSLNRARGWAVLTDTYKYTRYSTGKNAEILVDLTKDPGELHNLTRQPDHGHALRQLRQLLAAWQERTPDRSPELETRA